MYIFGVWRCRPSAVRACHIRRMGKVLVLLLILAAVLLCIVYFVKSTQAKVLSLSGSDSYTFHHGKQDVFCAYWCGYNFAEVFIRYTFPNFESQYCNNTHDHGFKHANKHDILVLGALRGECRHVVDVFKGRILLLNPEFHGVEEHVAQKVIHIGPRTLHYNSIQLYYVMLAAMELYARESPTDTLQEPLLSNRTFWYRRQHGKTRQRFLLYASSRCLPHRDEAFTQFSSIDLATTTGRCGQSPHANFTRLKKVGGWQQYVDLFSPLGFKFALVMENTLLPGYITEKILVAFLAGMIPIYYGTEEVFEIFNPRAFVYYNASVPQKAINEVARLHRSRNDFDRMLQEDIFVPGALQRFFSFAEVRAQIREKIGKT